MIGGYLQILKRILATSLCLLVISTSSISALAYNCANGEHNMQNQTTVCTGSRIVSYHDHKLPNASGTYKCKVVEYFFDTTQKCSICQATTVYSSSQYVHIPLE